MGQTSAQLGARTDPRPCVAGQHRGPTSPERMWPDARGTQAGLMAMPRFHEDAVPGGRIAWACVGQIGASPHLQARHQQPDDHRTGSKRFGEPLPPLPRPERSDHATGLMIADAVRYMSVHSWTQWDSHGLSGTSPGQKQQPARPGKSSSRAISAGGGRCWVRTGSVPNGRSHGQARTASPTPLDLAQKGQASHGEAGPMEVVTCCVVRKRPDMEPAAFGFAVLGQAGMRRLSAPRTQSRAGFGSAGAGVRAVPPGGAVVAASASEPIIAAGRSARSRRGGASRTADPGGVTLGTGGPASQAWRDEFSPS